MLLTITTFGKKEQQPVAAITQAIADCDCAINESRMTSLATNTVFSLLVEGNWNHIAKLETLLEQLSGELEIKTFCNRSEPSDGTSKKLPYNAEVFGLRSNNLLADLAAFFIANNIDIREMTTSCHPAYKTETPLFTAHFILELPSNIRLITLREDFLDFCDNSNLDAILEPVKR